MRVFRDDSNLAASPDLWSSVEAALDQSEYFILLASPGSAASKWVDREVKHFLSKNPLSRLGVVLVAGTSSWTDEHTTPETDAISKTVHALFDQAGLEPLVVDLRSTIEKGWRRRRRDEFLNRVASIVAAILQTDKDRVFGEHIRAQRRAILGLIGGLGIIAGLAIIAFMQFRLADRRLTQAVAVARHIHEVLDERLALVAGAASIRRDLLEDSAQLLNELIGQTAESESDVRFQRMGAHVRRGRLAFDTEALQKAAQEFDSAIELARQFPLSVEREWAWTQEVARARIGRGDMFEAGGNLARAFGEFEAARLVLVKFAGVDADSMMLRRHLSQALGRLHAVHKARGDVHQASELLEEALSIDKELVDQWPDDVAMRTNLANTYTHLADLNLDRNELVVAASQYHQAERLLDSLIPDNPINATLQDSWIVAVTGAGIVQLYQGHRDTAATLFDRATVRVTSLLEREPTQVFWKQLLAATIRNLGDTYAAVGDQDAAEMQYRHAILLVDELLLRDATNALLISQRADLDTDLGDLAWERSDYAKALPYYEQAYERFSELHQRDPNNSDWAYRLATSHERLGNLGSGEKSLSGLRSSIPPGRTLWKPSFGDIQTRGIGCWLKRVVWSNSRNWRRLKRMRALPKDSRQRSEVSRLFKRRTLKIYIHSHYWASR